MRVLTSLAFIGFCVTLFMGAARSENGKPELVLQRAHTYKYPSAACFSDDGKTLVSVGYDGEVKEWDTRTGAVLRTWMAGRSGLNTALFSRDGKLLATCIWNGDYPERFTIARAQIALWDMVSRRQLHVLRLDDRPLKSYESRPLNISLAFSNDGKYFATVTEWGRAHVTIWDTQTGKVQAQIKSDAPLESGGFMRAVFSPDGQSIATYAAYHQPPIKGDTYGRIPSAATVRVQIWNAQTGVLKQTIPDLPARYINGDFNRKFQIAWSRDGSTLAVIASDEGDVFVPNSNPEERLVARLWNVASGETLREENWSTPIRSYGDATLRATLLPDAQSIAVFHDGKIEIENLKSGEVTRALSYPEAKRFDPNPPVYRLYAPENSDELWADQNVEEGDYPAHRFLVWDLKSGQLHRVWKNAEMPLLPLAFSRDGKRMTRRFENGVEILDVATGKVLVASRLLSGAGAKVWAVALNFHHKVLACAAESKLLFWNAQSNTPKIVEIEKTKPNAVPPIIKALAFSPDGKWLAAGGGRDLAAAPLGFVEIYNAQNGRLTNQFARGDSIVTGVAFLPDGITLVVGDGKGRLRLWNALTGKLESTLPDQGSVTSVAVSLNGQNLAWGSHNNFATLWSLKTQKQLHKLQPSYWGKAIALSPDGKTVAGVNECDVQLWSTQNGELRHTLQGHVWPLMALAFSPDGKILASGSQDGEVQLWDVPSGAQKRVLTGHIASVRSLIFTHDGKTLISSSDDGSVRFWNVARGEPLLTLLLPARPTQQYDGSGNLFRTVLTGWLAYTPDGFYDGSANVEKFIRWRMNDELFPAEKFKAQMHRPDLIAQVLSAPR